MVKVESYEEKGQRGIIGKESVGTPKIRTTVKLGTRYGVQ